MQCFLSLREASTNAIEHANASRIDVVLESPASDSLTPRFADDGAGFDTKQTFSSPAGLGPSMIRERAESIRGSAQILSTPGKGTRATITVPPKPDPTSTQDALESEK
ncbi:MAG: ATP-binding protein [Pseudomonadota bacterium]|nr:ATP-binding protein [Pseudomonadota bacterium]